MLNRRLFLATSLGAVSSAHSAPPLKIGHRQASMMRGPSLDVFELASRIPGLSGVELQIFMKDYTLWARETALAYKREANRYNLRIPSLAGIWPPGHSLVKTGTAAEPLRKAIEAGELLGASVILVAAFKAGCPDMADEASFGPVVELLRKVAPAAANAGLTLGIENSLDMAGNRKLIDLVAHPAVRVFWDLDNVEFYGFKGQSVSGLEALGTARICQIHCKNEDRLLEQPGRVDWAAAFTTCRGIGYDGWYVFESRHSSPEQCVEATRRNIEFIRRCLSPDPALQPLPPVPSK